MSVSLIDWAHIPLEGIWWESCVVTGEFGLYLFCNLVSMYCETWRSTKWKQSTQNPRIWVPECPSDVPEVFQWCEPVYGTCQYDSWMVHQSMTQLPVRLPVNDPICTSQCLDRNIRKHLKRHHRRFPKTAGPLNFNSPLIASYGISLSHYLPNLSLTVYNLFLFFHSHQTFTGWNCIT